MTRTSVPLPQSTVPGPPLQPEGTPRGHIVRRTLSLPVGDEVLTEEFQTLYTEDKGVADEAYKAYLELANVPYDSLDDNAQEAIAHHRDPGGFVQRRAPKNPLRSAWLGPFRVKKEKRDKVSDPALERNPLHGRLVVALMSSAALVFVFFQALVYNKAVRGSFHDSQGQNGISGIHASTLLDLGGLSTNHIRAGDIYRIFWAMWMHSGWVHIAFNVACQLQFLWMMEPDWGFWRSFAVYFVSGVTGNLVSAVVDPCSTTVGSSGGLFGLMGAMIPYCIEYWKSIPRPSLILAFSGVVLIASILTGFTGTSDNWAHMGGGAGGLLFSLMTITSVSACDEVRFSSYPPFKWCAIRRSKASTVRGADTGAYGGQHERDRTNGNGPLLHGPEGNNKIVGPDGKTRKKIVKRHTVARLFQRKVKPGCKCGVQEFVVRGVSFSLLAILWALLWYHLLIDYEYSPPGHVTYTAIRSCCCCYTGPKVLKSKENWNCYYCDLSMSKSLTWGQQCAALSNLGKSKAALQDVVEKLKSSADRDDLLTLLPPPPTIEPSQVSLMLINSRLPLPPKYTFGQSVSSPYLEPNTSAEVGSAIKQVSGKSRAKDALEGAERAFVEASWAADQLWPEQTSRSVYGAWDDIWSAWLLNAQKPTAIKL